MIGKMDQQIGAVFAVMRALLWPVVVSRGLSKKSNALNWFVYAPTVTYGQRFRS